MFLGPKQLEEQALIILGGTLKITPDGGFVAAGDINSFGAGGSDILLLKFR